MLKVRPARNSSVLRTPDSIYDLLKRRESELPSWICPALLPKRGKLLFGGPAKIGKSMIMLELARALSLGVPPFGWRRWYVPERTRVLVIEQELGEYGLRKRAEIVFRSALEAAKSIYVVSKDPEVILSSTEGRQRLRYYLDAVRPDVLILDPISKFHFYDENDPIQIGRLLQFLDTLTREAERDLSIIFSHHFRKGPATDFQRQGFDPLDPYNFGGSRKWFDDPDAIVTLQKQRSFTGPAGHRAWELRARFELRHDEGPPDVLLRVNENGDLRVLYAGMIEQPSESLTAVLRARREERLGRTEDFQPESRLFPED